MKDKNTKGSMLVEVLVAVALSALVLVGIIQASSRSVSNSGFARRQAEATALADKAIQLVKNFKTGGGWEDLPIVDTTYCFDGTSVVPNPECPISNTEYTGVVNVTLGSDNEVKIVSEVKWVEGIAGNAKTFSAKKEAVLYRY